MIQSIVTCGKIITRVLLNGVQNFSTTSTDKHSSHIKKKSEEDSCNLNSESAIFTAVSGLPKDLKSCVVKQRQIGDDAWFIARNKIAEVIGVADGVGGWRQYGIDPGIFSSTLMRTCETFVSSGRFNPSNPAALIAQSYRELFEMKQCIVGSSTVCVVMLNKTNNRLYTANIGDSGFLIVRKGKIVHRSEEQQHYFNTPFQLSLAPPGASSQILNDSPEIAETSEFDVETGDLILVGTDGLFDNMPDSLILSQLTTLHAIEDCTYLQKLANSLALQARNLSLDSNYLSPFSKNAQKNGIFVKGGKPDDITVLLAAVVL